MCISNAAQTGQCVVLTPTVGYTLLSQDFSVTAADSANGLFSFSVKAVSSDTNFIVSSVTVNGFPSISAQYKALNTFAFTGISATCSSKTYTITATLCQILTASTGSSIGTCRPNGVTKTSTFSFVSTPNQISTACSMTAGGSSISDLTAIISDVGSIGSNVLYATDIWTIAIQSATLGAAGCKIGVSTVIISDGSGGTITMAGSCFTSIVSKNGATTIQFPANLLPASVTSYSTPTSATIPGWTPSKQMCSNGIILASTQRTATYRFTLDLTFPSDGSNQLPPLKRKDEESISDSISVNVTVSLEKTKTNGSSTGLNNWYVIAASVFSVGSALLVLFGLWNRNKMEKRDVRDSDVEWKMSKE
ncbi:hypothetical protein BCR33DRAFT_848097 [Rhizoclosmatium globosum]|uniref:Uncharacterized protein n=1 Tax=Rhizoclosmatium globosum TaxID=329046 RepID=A0A1Y2CLX0_9FUNG|nr:hypothetical protein BCR33DRAFT_848097 [Rhizoclosmatium globosum]|eukprot:ORY48021.1 hypothetical protein BCR33DRAFT_848097 [Rhizoclosmatium globosum]